MSDTSPAMEARYRAMLLARGPEERLAMASSMFDAARQIAIASIRAANPRISEVELRQKLFLRYYGDEFGPEQRANILKGIAAAWERSEEPESESRELRP